MDDLIAVIFVLLWVVIGLVNLVKKSADAKKRSQQNEQEITEYSESSARELAPQQREQFPSQSAQRPVPTRPVQRPTPKQPIPPRPVARPVSEAPSEPPQILQELLEMVMPSQPPRKVHTPIRKPPEPPRQVPKPSMAKQAPKTKVRKSPASPNKALQFSKNPVVNGLIFSEILGKPIARRSSRNRRVF